MISHDKTVSFHDKMVAGLRMLYKYEKLTAREFNNHMVNENAVNLLWIILDNGMAEFNGSKYKLTAKGKTLMKKALATDINFNNYDLQIR